MGKGFGIAALIVAILAFFVPIYGFVGSWLALILATIGALAGDRAFAVATAIIAPINIFLLSPSTWILLADKGASNIILTGSAIFVAAPFVAMLFGKKPDTPRG